MSYRVEFYEDEKGYSEVWEYLEELRIRSSRSKDAGIQYRQISMYIQLLQDNGTLLSSSITKHLGDDLWELRPGANRVLYFYYKSGTYVLLSCFRKKTNKTPGREIEKAKRLRDDYILRYKEDDQNENVGRL